MKRAIAIATLMAALCTGSAAQAAEMPASQGGAPAAAAPAAASSDSAVHQTITLDGRVIPYTATAGTIVLKDAQGQATCSMFYVGYTADGVTDLSRRPVTFLYNGGPGAASVFLRMASFGPKRVLMTDAANTPPSPYELVDNQYSLLDKTDLVFVDAPGTGFSRLAPTARPEDFYGVDQDARAFKRFVDSYLSQNGRWNSPKFLFGESYGTTRSAVLANMLQQSGTDLNGVVLLSSALNFGTGFLDGDGLDDLYIGYLPTEAAIAWYHNKVPNKPAQLAPFVETVRQFAIGEYGDALLKGSTLSASERDDVVRKLHAYTGLSEQYLRNADLRVEPGEFEKELLRSDYRTVGRLDGRFVGIDNKAIGDAPDYDATNTNAEITGFNDYVRSVLHYQTDLTYEQLSFEVNNAWDLTHTIDGNKQVVPDVLPDLHDAMTQNPHLRVFSANGYYDMATPFFGTQYSLLHMNLDPSLRGNISYGFYESGHMVYLHEPALAQFRADLERWYDSALH
jgi:carboxypeptidase C (cathepsin A)